MIEFISYIIWDNIGVVCLFLFEERLKTYIWVADKDPKHDYTPDLLILKEMILQFARGNAVNG